MNVSTNVSTHIIVFKDGSKKFINEKAYRFIWEESLKESSIIHIGGQLINLHSIKTLSSLDEYYAQYPNEKPRENFKDWTGKGFAEIINGSGNKALEGMIKGLKKYISSNQYKGTEAPLELLKLMEKKLNLTNN
jgi:hypothetical protein